MADTLARATDDGRREELPLVEPSATTGLFEVFRRRYLLKLLVRREIAARYQGSFLGMIWSYINPLSQFFMFYVVIGIIIYFFSDKLSFLGKLPGDIRIEKENFRFYFPITTMIILSILLTVIINIIKRFF